MSREVQRKLRSPNADHLLARRDSSGTVQTSSASSQTGLTTTGSPTGATLASFTVTNPNLVLNTEGSLTVAGAATGSTFKLTRDGTTTVVTVSGVTATTSTFGVNTHTTPLNSPSYNLTIDAAGSTATVSYTLSREDRWV